LREEQEVRREELGIRSEEWKRLDVRITGRLFFKFLTPLS
jgi:hypothetical protein